MHIHTIQCFIGILFFSYFFLLFFFLTHRAADRTSMVIGAMNCLPLSYWLFSKPPSPTAPWFCFIIHTQNGHPVVDQCNNGRICKKQFRIYFYWDVSTTEHNNILYLAPCVFCRVSDPLPSASRRKRKKKKKNPSRHRGGEKKH